MAVVVALACVRVRVRMCLGALGLNFARRFHGCLCAIYESCYFAM